MPPLRRLVTISTFTRVAFVTAARSLPEAQSIRVTRSLWINLATILLSLIAAMFLSLGPIIFRGFGQTLRQGRNFILSGWPVCWLWVCEVPHHFPVWCARQ